MSSPTTRPSYLIDTSVLSELMRPDPTPAVVQFLTHLDHSWLSIITIHELQYGLHLLAPGSRRTVLESKLNQLLASYHDSILPIPDAEAAFAAHFRTTARKQGRQLHLADALIAGTAKAHGLTIATRNIKDFSNIDIDVVDPWAATD